MARYTFRALDLADDEEFDAFVRVRREAGVVGRPHVVPASAAEVASVWRCEDSGWVTAARGAFSEGDLVAVATSQRSVDDNRDTAWIFVHTLPGHRRQGLAGRLARDVVRALDDDVRKVMSWVMAPDAADETHPHRRFVTSLAGWVEGRETSYALDLPTELPDMTLDARYALEVHVDGVPPHRQADLGRLKGLVEVEAPTGEAEWEGAAVTPARYRQQVEALLGAGGHLVETLVIDQATDAVVGYTQIEIAPGAARPVTQQGTLVLGEHRGRALGRALKVTNLRALQERWPHVTRVVTEIDDDNIWMQRINEELGFAAVEAQLIVRFPRDAT